MDWKHCGNNILNLNASEVFTLHDQLFSSPLTTENFRMKETRDFQGRDSEPPSVDRMSVRTGFAPIRGPERPSLRLRSRSFLSLHFGFPLKQEIPNMRASGIIGCFVLKPEI